MWCGVAVPGAGLEPARPEGRQILSLLRLPFRHPGVGRGAAESYLSAPHRSIRTRAALNAIQPAAAPADRPAPSVVRPPVSDQALTRWATRISARVSGRPRPRHTAGGLNSRLCAGGPDRGASAINQMVAGQAGYSAPRIRRRRTAAANPQPLAGSRWSFLTATPCRL